MIPRTWLLLLALAGLLHAEGAAHKTHPPAASLSVRQALEAGRTLERSTLDSLAGAQRLAQDSLHLFRDSLIARPDTELDAAIRDSIRHSCEGFDSSLSDLKKTLQASIESLKAQRLEMPLKGVERLDPETAADSARDLLEGFADTLTDVRGDGREALLDRLSDLRDSLERMSDAWIEAKDRADSLVERANDSLDRRFEKATRLGFSSDMASRYPWHGRDDGKGRLVWTPELAFHHESGLSINASFTTLTAANAAFAAWTVGGDYDWKRFDWVHLDLAYAYEAATRDSEQVPALRIHDLSLEGGFSISLEGIGLPATSLEPSLRGALEQSGNSRDVLVTTSIVLEQELWKSAGRRKVTLEPHWILETGTLKVDRSRTVVVGAGKKKVTTTQDFTNSKFQNLDWDAVLPAHFYWGGLEAAPMLHWIKPLHSLPGERAAGYFYLELPLTASLPL